MLAYTALRERTPWWFYSLISTSIIMTLQAFTSSMSRKRSWLVEGITVNPLTEDELIGDYLRGLTFEQPPLDVSIRKRLKIRERWRRWTVRLYISLVLLCALSGFLSLLLPRPTYYPLIVTLIPFASAYFLARTWKGGSRRRPPLSRPLGLSQLLYMA